MRNRKWIMFQDSVIESDVILCWDFLWVCSLWGLTQAVWHLQNWGIGRNTQLETHISFYTNFVKYRLAHTPEVSATSYDPQKPEIQPAALRGFTVHLPTIGPHNGARADKRRASQIPTRSSMSSLLLTVFTVWILVFFQIWNQNEHQNLWL